MTKIIGYKIESANTAHLLATNVNNAIEHDGYEPLGQMTISPDGKFHQTMVQYDEVKTTKPLQNLEPGGIYKGH